MPVGNGGTKNGKVMRIKCPSAHRDNLIGEACKVKKMFIYLKNEYK